VMGNIHLISLLPPDFAMEPPTAKQRSPAARVERQLERV
jgi:hypothetical protein